MADVTLGSLIVTLGADAKPLLDGARQAELSLANLDKRMMAGIGTMAKVGAAAAATGVAIVAGLVKSGLEAIDAQVKLARSVDGTIGGLRALEKAAGNVGVSQDELRKSVETLTVRLGEAIRGEGRMKAMLDELGLSAEHLMSLDVDERIAAIADRVREMGLSTAQTADLLRTFGIRNIEMADLLRQGGDAIREQAREVDQLGLRLSMVDATQIEMANSAMGILDDVLTSIRDKVTVAIAPFIAEFAERFREAAIEAEGFGKHATRAIEFVFTGLAKVADVIQGLRVVWKGLELVAVGFGAAVTSVMQIGVEAIVKFNDEVLKAVNFTIRQLNRLPKVDIAEIDPFGDSEFMRGFRRMADEMRNKVGETRAELHELAMQELPSSKVEEFFDSVRERARQAAEQVIEARESLGRGAEGFGTGPAMEERDAEAERLAAEEERFREYLDAKLRALQAFVASEEELEVANHLRRLEDLEELLENERILEDEYRALREALEEEHMDRIAQIRERGMSDLERFTESSFKDQVSTVSQQLANMTSGVATHNKKMFELNKMAGISNAIISTHAGVAKALEAYPPPLSFSMAAAQAAAGFAQVQAIRSQSFGGANAAPSLAGSTPAPPVTPAGGEQGAGGAAGGGQVVQRRVFALEGIDPDRLFSGRQLRNLWESLMEVVEDGNNAGIRTDVVFT